MVVECLLRRSMMHHHTTLPGRSKITNAIRIQNGLTRPGNKERIRHTVCLCSKSVDSLLNRICYLKRNHVTDYKEKGIHHI
uniref:Uncharacterized protein n=1 Tax=Kalanchoe fedtschenkoi TaxID=63787 RepID=A0A7N0R8F0_KALFE